MEIEGYKGFYADKTNNYGNPFEEGNIYKINGLVKFGLQGNGFHMCKNIEDVFRYFPYNKGEKEVTVAKVIGSGNYCQYDDEYYGYFDMYAVERIFIERFLAREEIIEKMLNSNPIALKKFISTFELTDKERSLFFQKYINEYEVITNLLYYSGHKDIYYKDRSEVDTLSKKYAYGMKK